MEANLIHRFSYQVWIQCWLMCHKPFLQLEYESGRISGRAIEVPAHSFCEVESVLGTGYRNKGKSSLLFHSFLRLNLPGWKYSFIHSYQKYRRKFQSLCSMNGHELHLISLYFHIRIGIESNMMQVIRQSCLLTTGHLILIDRLLQFRQIIQPVLGSLGTKGRLITRGIKNLSEKIRYAFSFCGSTKSLNQSNKAFRIRSLIDLIFSGREQGFPETYSMFLSVLLEEVHTLLTDITLGLVHHTAKGQIVLVGNHAKVRQGILHLLAVEELHARIDGIRNLRLNECLF